MMIMKKMRAFAVFLLSMSVLWTSGCASIVHGTRQKIAITSRPAGADVSIDGEARGQTPLEVELKRKDDHKVVLSQKGSSPQEVRLENRISGWFWGNLGFGGLVGLVIDATNGAMYKLKPDKVSVQFQASDESPIASSLPTFSQTQKQEKSSLHSQGVYGVRYEAGENLSLSVAKSFLGKLKEERSIGTYRILDYVYQSDDLRYLKSGFPQGYVFDFKNLKQDASSANVRVRLVQFPEAKVLWEGSCHSADPEACIQYLMGQYRQASL